MTQKNRSPGIDDPDAENAEQADEGSQAQTVARDAEIAQTDLSEDSERGGHKDPAQMIPDDTPDLVEHMRDMNRSGRIDMGAYEGEENMDDEDGSIPE